jgi:hypothetical protein
VKGRLVAVVCAVTAVSTAAVPATSSSAPPKRLVDCGRVEFVSGLEAVFGRFKTQPAAERFRTSIVRLGFQNASIIPGCDGFRVVVRGIENYDIGVELQSEARHAKLTATIECIKGKDDVGELEVVFGHRRTRLEAQQLVARAASVGFTGLQLEPDPCGGFEVMFNGFTSRTQAEEFVGETRGAGFDAVIEKS